MDSMLDALRPTGNKIGAGTLLVSTYVGAGVRVSFDKPVKLCRSPFATRML
jgi:hypothetical protein